MGARPTEVPRTRAINHLTTPEPMGKTPTAETRIATSTCLTLMRDGTAVMSLVGRQHQHLHQEGTATARLIAHDPTATTRCPARGAMATTRLRARGATSQIVTATRRARGIRMARSLACEIRSGAALDKSIIRANQNGMTRVGPAQSRGPTHGFTRFRARHGHIQGQTIVMPIWLCRTNPRHSIGI